MLAEHSKQDMEEVGSWTQAVNSSPHFIVRKRGELRATEHTMMHREVAFINTQGSGPGPANNRVEMMMRVVGVGGREGQDDSIDYNS